MFSSGGDSDTWLTGKRVDANVLERRRAFVKQWQECLAREEVYKAEKVAYDRALADYRARERPLREKREREHAEAVARYEQLVKAQAERERLFKEFAYREQLRGDVPRAELEARFRKLHPEWGKALPPPQEPSASTQWSGFYPPSDYKPANGDLGPPPVAPKPTWRPPYEDEGGLICVGNAHYYSGVSLFHPMHGYLILPYTGSWVKDANGVFIPCKGYRLDVAHDYIRNIGALAPG